MADATYDLIIIGGGAIGLSTAYHDDHGRCFCGLGSEKPPYLCRIDPFWLSLSDKDYQISSVKELIRCPVLCDSSRAAKVSFPPLVLFAATDWMSAVN